MPWIKYGVCCREHMLSKNKLWFANFGSEIEHCATAGLPYVDDDLDRGQTFAPNP